MNTVKYNKQSGANLDAFINTIFNRNLTDVVGTDISWNQPSVNVIETKTAYRIELVAPGLVRKDFDLTLENDKLTVSVQRKKQKAIEGETFKRREFNFSSFRRSFELPTDSIIENSIVANYENGILKIVLPKKEAAKPTPARKIVIS